MYNLVQSLKAAGEPIDGIGIQAHLLWEWVPDIEVAWGKLASLGVDIAITELDIRVRLPLTPEKISQQRMYYKKATKACLDIPRCVGITIWDFTDVRI